jgi:hypothetical protein
VTFETTFTQGQRQLILAGGDSDASDVDAEIVEKSTGRVVVSDSSVGPYAVLAFTPQTSGWYVLRVKLYETRTSGSFVAAAMLSRGGISLPIDSLVDAGDNLMSYCRVVMLGELSRGNIASFQDHLNQWAVFGSILRSGQTSRVFNIRPGAGRQIIVAAGDSNARDIDLVLDANEESVVLASDVERDEFPQIEYRTLGSRDYGVTTKMHSSTNDRYSLVLTAVLSAH